MRLSLLVCLLDFTVSFVGWAAPSRADEPLPRVRFEVSVPVGANSLQAHTWAKALEPLARGGVRISSTAGKPSVEKTSVGGTAIYQVHGVITKSGKLQVPGAEFRVRDKARLRKWINQLDQKPAPTKLAFGFTVDQMLAVHDKLSATVVESTKGRPGDKVAIEICTLAQVRLELSDRASLPGDAVLDELQGLSCGTSLVALLRPWGLVAVPRIQGTQIVMTVSDVRRAKEFWPVGWPAKKKAHELIPKLWDKVEVEVTETPIGEAAAVIRSQLDVPMLWDHNGMARQRIDPARDTVAYQSAQTFYQKLLDRLLLQVNLKEEVRVDEANRPFLWISPKRQPRPAKSDDL